MKNQMVDASSYGSLANSEADLTPADIITAVKVQITAPRVELPATVDLEFPYLGMSGKFITIGGAADGAPRWIKTGADIRYAVSDNVVHVTMPRAFAVRRKFIAAA